MTHTNTTFALKYIEWNSGFDFAGPIKCVFKHSQVTKQKWDECVEVYRSLYSSMSHEYCRLWINWKPEDLIVLLHRTCPYTDVPIQEYEELSRGWTTLFRSAMDTWNKLVPAVNEVGDGVLILEDDEDDIYNQLGVLLHDVILDGGDL